MAEAQVLNGEETLQRSEGRVLPYEQWKKEESAREARIRTEAVKLKRAD